MLICLASDDRFLTRRRGFRPCARCSNSTDDAPDVWITGAAALVIERCAARGRDQSLNIVVRLTLTGIGKNTLPIEREALVEDKRKIFERRRVPDKQASISLAAIDADIGAAGYCPHVAIFEPDRNPARSRGDMNVAGSKPFRHNGAIVAAGAT